MAEDEIDLPRAIRRLYRADLERSGGGTGLTGRIKTFGSELAALFRRNPWWSRLAVGSVAAVVALAAWGVIYVYNYYSLKHNYCDLYYSEVSVELKRRENLIPNLAQCVGGYSAHEKDVMKHIAEVRQILASAAGVQTKVEAVRQIQATLFELIGTVEQYPDLKASLPTQALLKELAETENRIVESKMKYNDAARAFNNILTTFPTNEVGRLLGIRKPIPYLTTEEDLLKVPLVRFGEKAP